MKINLALADYPTFSCLPERVGQHRTTIHLLPQVPVTMRDALVVTSL